MTFAIGIFDLFTYAITGSLYFALLGYVTFRLHWVDPAAAGRVPSLLLVIAVVVISYLLGYMAYPLGRVANRIVPRRRHRNARAEFLRRNPTARDRPFVQADIPLLGAAVRMHDKDTGAEISRLRATALMVRSSAPVVALAMVVAVVEVFTGGKPVFAALTAVALAAGFLALISQFRRLDHMANMVTLELCFFVPEIDNLFTEAPEAG